MPEQTKRLLRSRQERMLGGVCGGIAEYFNVDPTLVRLAAVVLAIVSSIVPGLLLYAVLWIVIPEGTGDPAGDDFEDLEDDLAEAETIDAEAWAEEQMAPASGADEDDGSV